MAAGKLYVVGTPIGNRGDLSPRARETFAAADWQGILAVSGKRRGPVTVDVACTNLPWLFDQVLASDGAIELIGPTDVLGTYAAYASSLLADPPQS